MLPASFDWRVPSIWPDNWSPFLEGPPSHDRGLLPLRRDGTVVSVLGNIEKMVSQAQPGELWPLARAVVLDSQVPIV